MYWIRSSATASFCREKFHAALGRRTLGDAQLAFSPSTFWHVQWPTALSLLFAFSLSCHLHLHHSSCMSKRYPRRLVLILLETVTWAWLRLMTPFNWDWRRPGQSWIGRGCCCGDFQVPSCWWHRLANCEGLHWVNPVASKTVDQSYWLPSRDCESETRCCFDASAQQKLSRFGLSQVYSGIGLESY